MQLREYQAQPATLQFSLFQCPICFDTGTVRIDRKHTRPCFCKNKNTKGV